MSKKTVQFKAKGADVKFDANVKKAVDKVVEDATPDQVLVQRHDTQTEQDQLAGAPFQREMDEQFPVDLNAYDDRDNLMKMKLGTQPVPGSGITEFGQLQATDADFKWLEKKRAQAELANLQAWFARHYDKASPEQKRTARELYPEFYSMRVELLEKNIRLLERIAKLKVLGAQNRKDVLLQYAIASGYIPEDPLENILHPERAAAQATENSRKARYNRGLLNPRARQRDDAKITRWNPRDQRDEEVTERYWNSARLLGRDPAQDPAFASKLGAPNGTGFYSSYRSLLDTLKGSAPAAAPVGGAGN